MQALPTPSDPRLSALLELWNERRGIRSMPARADIDTLELVPWFNWLILLGRDEAGALRYRVHGTACAAGYGMDLTGRRTEDVCPADREFYGACHREVTATGVPQLRRYTREREGHGRRAIEQLWLPMSSDGATVDRILSCGFYSRA